MTRITSLALLVSSLAWLAPGCGGGSGAALSYHVFPGDRMVNGRRLESLARLFETQYGCVESDEITIVGFAPGTYNVDGCAHEADFVLQCRPGGYSQICDWQQLADLAQQAAVDFRCDPASIGYQVTQGFVRTVDGCGYQAQYQFERGQWMLLGRISQVGPVTSGVTTTTTVSGSAYVQ